MWTNKVMTATAIALLSHAITIFTAKPVPLPGLDGLRSYDSQEAQHQRQVFFVGGKYQTDPTTNLTLFVNQMYTEQLIPANGVKHPNPLIFFHGGAFSGAVRFPTQNLKKPLRSFHSDPCLSDSTDMAPNTRQPPRLGILLPRPRLPRLPRRCSQRRPLLPPASNRNNRRNPSGSCRSLLQRLREIPNKLSTGETPHAMAWCKSSSYPAVCPQS